MRLSAVAAGLIALATLASGTVAAQAATVVTSPAALPAKHDTPRVFLGGSIEMGAARDWQADLIAALSDEQVTVLNPRRPDWDPNWKPVASEPNFRQQVQWELAALEGADIIVMYLAPARRARSAFWSSACTPRAARSSSCARRASGAKATWTSPPGATVSSRSPRWRASSVQSARA
ncbi:nucleoside 2-deoxyribosyltransferase domain-containing protein [Novosphingobium panipatense]